MLRSLWLKQLFIVVWWQQKWHLLWLLWGNFFKRSCELFWKMTLHLWWPLKEPFVFTYNILQVLIGWKAKLSFRQCENRFCLHKRVNWQTEKNSKTLWERPFLRDTRWLREGTESLTPAEYPWDNDHNRTWLQCRGFIQDYTAGTVRNITKENLTKHR